MTMYYSCLIFAILLSFPSAYGGVVLKPDYYKDQCRNIEGDIATAVAKKESENPGICAGVIRLFFHDCFVKGCDGSVLLDIPKTSEKYSPDNLGLRGFDVIQAAKEAAEASCGNPSPAVVSCADVLAYAARDCVKLLGGFTYNVVAGRLDSIVSNADDTKGNLPGANFNFKQLETNFTNKGLSVTDLVALTGAHSIGQAHCKSFEERFNKVDENEIDPTYAANLKGNCSTKTILDQDHKTPNSLDVQWYKNEIKNQVLFLSDWELRTDTFSENLMNKYASTNSRLIPRLTFTAWQDDFGNAMEKMGNILGGDGEIRKVCSKVN